ncbi:hypothetical protein H257_05015 [Aphanomyces astaci]|uniref:RING-type domain-containing protein n=1 Tax=Aphanomyces astaci TaxID=112090 RepID=W4GSP6_APHAT|nr:hypothetical protein H257_05015 [Aphanomyces astaci]ETV82356.1 hypothetical protein H257_05015 [Aphanomyces astaci]RHY07944.1 hypothetical protein DYB36_004410 [Aphanomyces astaci]RHY17927.1 hypothetical protein DYB25_002042 [Aphanomyces astaci]RHY41289.1 hypothetical protein DYB38_010017 [Aphanomyces astaci]RHY44657.1 hypothetical protein DYB34_010352 [Aphanomyces astaci]|eukprot:XP_009828025.1 hypothetical protein H257_05015 [Aphanomyces astaci]
MATATRPLQRSHSDLNVLEITGPREALVALKAKTATPSLDHKVTLCLSEQDECPICLDEFTPLGASVFTGECGHKFHFTCLLENVNHDEANSTKCPICRKTQTQWPEPTSGLAKAHPCCTNCGKRGTGGQFCDGCGHSLAHTPTAAERARMAAQGQPNNVIVECPACRIRCLVSSTARGTLQCPNGHLFTLRMPSSSGAPANLAVPPPPPFRGGAPGGGVVMRQCPTCLTRVQMPPGSQAGQYMCPQGHTFTFRP